MRNDLGILAGGSWMELVVLVAAIDESSISIMAVCLPVASTDTCSAVVNFSVCLITRISQYAICFGT